MLTKTEQVIRPEIDKYMCIGELSLDGEIKPVNGILTMAICALEDGIVTISPKQIQQYLGKLSGPHLETSGHSQKN